MDYPRPPPAPPDSFDPEHSRHRAAILDLMHAYAEVVDRRAWDGFSRIFTGDALLLAEGYEFSGLEAIVAAMRLNERYELTQHHVTNHRVELRGATAAAETYCLAVNIIADAGGRLREDMGIRYRDRLVLADGRWLIRRRDVIKDWRGTVALQP